MPVCKTPEKTSLPERPKISFVTNCMSRLHHLEVTFLKNIEDNQDYPETEFVLLNYGYDWPMDQWAQKVLPELIASGKVRYYRTDKFEFYHISHAKNIAHRLADGNIVCNLDADNFTGKGFASFLAETLRENSDRVVHGHWSLKRGSTGRIALLKSHFLKYGGYDESFQGWGTDDMDFIARLTGAGLESFMIQNRDFLNLIEHSDKQRASRYPSENQDIKKSMAANEERSAASLALKNFTANEGKNWGSAKLRKNFSEEIIEI